MREFLIVLLVMAATAGAVLFYYSTVFEDGTTSVERATALDTGVFFGEEVSMGDGVAQTWVVLEAGKPTSLGVSISRNTLSGLPSEPSSLEYVLRLPEEATITPFRYLTLDWNAHGHEPPGIYDVPHFDVHFYMMSNAARLAITADDPGFSVEPGSAYLPETYQLVPGGVPQMGAHWVDATAPEFQGEPFTTTFIYGSYDGEVAFYEPMVATSFLQTNPDFSEAIKQPSAYPAPGFYPASYSVRYDAETGVYRISLDKFALR